MEAKGLHDALIEYRDNMDEGRDYDLGVIGGLITDCERWLEGHDDAVSTVCYDVPAGSLEDGNLTVATPAE